MDWEHVILTPRDESQLFPLVASGPSADGSGTDATALNGDTYSGAASITGNHNAGDRLYAGSMSGGLRNPVILHGWADQVKRLPADWLLAGGGGHSSGNGFWLAPEALTSLPGGLTANITPYPLGGTLSFLFSIPRTSNSSTLTEQIARGRLDPRGVLATQDPSGLPEIAAFAPTFPDASYPVADTLHLTEFFSGNSLAIPFPTGRGEYYLGGGSVSLLSFEPGRGNGYFWYISSLDWYVITSECGICVIPRASRGPLGTPIWSPYQADTLRPSRAGSLSVAKDLASDGLLRILEGAYLGLVADGGVASAGNRAMIRQYGVDPSTFAATVESAIFLSGLVPGGVSGCTILGVGIGSCGFDTDAGQETVSNWNLIFQSGGGPYTDNLGHGFTKGAPGSGDSSLAYTDANNSVFNFGLELQIAASRWPEINAQWWLYISCVSAAKIPYLIIASVDQVGRALTAQATYSKAIGPPLQPYPTYWIDQQAVAAAACAASRPPLVDIDPGLPLGDTQISDTSFDAVEFVGNYWDGDELANSSGITVVANPAPVGDLPVYIAQPLPGPKAWCDLNISNMLLNAKATTTSFQSCSGIPGEAGGHYLIACEGSRMMCGYVVSNLGFAIRADADTTDPSLIISRTNLISPGLKQGSGETLGGIAFNSYSLEIATGTHSTTTYVGDGDVERITTVFHRYSQAQTGAPIYMDTWATVLFVTPTPGYAGPAQRIDVSQRVSWSGAEIFSGEGILALAKATNYALVQPYYRWHPLQSWFFGLRIWIAEFVARDHVSKGVGTGTPHIEIRSMMDLTTVTALFNLQPPSDATLKFRSGSLPHSTTGYNEAGLPWIKAWVTYLDASYTSGDDWTYRRYSRTELQLKPDGTWERTDQLASTYGFDAPIASEAAGAAASQFFNQAFFKDASGVNCFL